MHKLLDILASGVHDAKNQLFIAESVIAAHEAEHGLDLGAARYAIEAAASRLSRTLAAYQLLREEGAIALTPVIVADLCDEVALAQRRHLASRQLELKVDCQVVDEWLLDRDLITDLLNNAVQNASRFARHQIKISAALDDDWLCLSVEDDGPGYATLPPRQGIGLSVAGKVAQLHRRHDRQGSLTLDNGGPAGGARCQLRLP